MPLKEAAKAQLTATVATEVAAQLKDDVTDEEEKKLNEQYTAIEIDYENEVISEV